MAEFERRQVLRAAAAGAVALPLLQLGGPARALVAGANTGKILRRPFELTSADGTKLQGEVDMPASPNGVAVIFSSGSGIFDRDMFFGNSGTPRDLVFKDLGARMAARGVMAVRADRRGARYGLRGPEQIDPKLTITATTKAQVDDIGAIYDWVRSPRGLGARRVAFLVHSEGTLHIGRLAASGAPAPAAVIGIGSLMESPKDVLHWQMAERLPTSIESLDRDGDTVITNDEIRAGWEMTPGAAGGLDAMLNPAGRWTDTDLQALRVKQQAFYEEQMRDAFAHADNAPYPNAETVVGPYQWWKSWFTDSTPNAVNLARWDTSFHFHYGAIDSQTNAPRQQAAARAALSPAKLEITVHPGVGHALGRHPALGPVEEHIADLIAEQAAAIA